MYRPRGSDKDSNVGIWRKNVPGRGNGKCEGPAAVFPVFEEEAGVTREGTCGEEQEMRSGRQGGRWQVV